jgi:hypothetical protein
MKGFQIPGQTMWRSGDFITQRSHQDTTALDQVKKTGARLALHIGR